MKYGRFIRSAGGWDALQRVLHRGLNRRGPAWRVDRHRCQPLRPRSARRRRRDRRRPPRRARRTSTTRCGIFAFTLTDGDRGEIAAALATLQPIHGDCGDEYRTPPFLTASGDLSHHLDEHAAALSHCSRRAARTHALPERHAVGVDGRLRPRGTARPRISVSGTTATLGDRVIGGRDPAAQAHFAIDKIEGALQSLGASLDDVVRTRVFVKNIATGRRWPERTARDSPGHAGQHAGRRAAGRRRLSRRDRGRRRARQQHARPLLGLRKAKGTKLAGSIEVLRKPAACADSLWTFVAQPFETNPTFQSATNERDGRPHVRAQFLGKIRLDCRVGRTGSTGSGACSVWGWSVFGDQRLRTVGSKEVQNVVRQSVGRETLVGRTVESGQPRGCRPDRRSQLYRPRPCLSLGPTGHRRMRKRS